MKYAYLFFSILLSFALILSSCTNDKTTNHEGNDEALETEDILDVLTNPTGQDSTSTLNENVQNSSDLSEEEKMKAKQHEEERKKIIADQMKESPNKGKDCDAVLKDYEKLVNNILKDGFSKHLEEMNKWNNDPLYNACKKLEQYKAKFEALNEKMNEDEEDVY